MLGIAIVTRNRRSHLQQVLEAVLAETTTAFDLVVADDGSTDGTRAFCDEVGAAWVGGENRGIAWNKNRALFALAEKSDPTTFILLEDDTRPIRRGWERLWIDASNRGGYVTYAHPKFMTPYLLDQEPRTILRMHEDHVAMCSGIS